MTYYTMMILMKVYWHNGFGSTELCALSVSEREMNLRQ